MNQRLLSTLLALALPAVMLQAADQSEKGLPPGLQKKGKIPPGHAKKHKGGAEELPAGAAAARTGSAATTAPTASTPATPANPSVTAPVPTASTPAKPATTPVATPTRSAAEVKAAAEKRIQAVNALDDKAAARKAGVAAISKETGATPAMLQNQREEHPKIGLAGVLFANELASRTGKPARVFYREQAEGKSWLKIAEANNVNLADVEAKLARVEQAMRGAK